MSRRTVSLLVGVSAASLFIALMSGIESGSGSSTAYFVFFLVPLGAVAFAWARRAPAVHDASWSTGGAPAVSTATAASARPRAGAGPAPGRSVAVALGRVEARELVSGLPFGLGLGFCALLFLLLIVVPGYENGDARSSFVQLAPWVAHPFVGLIVLAGHSAATRARRDGADELFDACPVGDAGRTAGFLVSAALPAAVLLGYLALFFGVGEMRSPVLQGAYGLDNVADVLAAVALGAGGLALGVALGRWIRFSVAPIVAVVAIAALTLRLNNAGDPGWNPYAELSTAPALNDTSPLFTSRPTWSHLLWVCCLVVATGLVAIARHRRDRLVGAVAVATAVLAIAGGVGATRAMPAADAALIADRITHAERHQRCTAAAPGLDVCVFTVHGSLGDRLRARLAPVVAGLPPAPAIIARQRYAGTVEQLPPKVRRLLPNGVSGGPPEEVPLGFHGDTAGIDEVAVDVALTRVALAGRADRDLAPEPIMGQARGVVALWLAGRGMSRGRAIRLASAVEPGSPSAVARGRPGLDVCAIAPVAWSAQDLAATRALMARPDPEVLAVVTGAWTRWLDPATGTDELLRTLGLPPVGPFDRFDPPAGSGC